MAINGSWDNAKKMLYAILENLPDGTGTSKAKLYFLAAVWILPHDRKAAGSYYATALKHDPAQDTRIYQALLLELCGDFDTAICTLGNINSTAILNQYLMFLLNGRYDIDIDSIIKEHEYIVFNESTHHAILLLSLRKSDFERAIKSADKLLQLRSHSALYLHLAGMTLYWKAISRNIPHEPGILIAVPISSGQKLNITEKEDATKAADYFFQAYEISKINKDNDMLTNTLIGLVSVNWILNNETIAKEKAKELLLVDKGNPIAAFSLLEYGDISSISLLELEERSNDDPSSALVYIRVLVKSDEHGAAKQALEKYANQIKSISIAEWVDISIWVAVRINDISFALPYT